MKKTITTLAAPGGVASDTPTPASSTLVAPGNLHDAEQGAEFGTQLTEQYRLAVGGMTQVLRFGAMMMFLRQNIDSTRGVDRSAKQGAKYQADTGIKAWLKVFAPEVKESTAYRFLHVAEAVAKEFQLPAKVSFIELATTQADQLSDKLRGKQEKLWEFVNGTSQRSWLDRFSPPKPVGGNQRVPSDSPLAAVLNKSPEEAEEMRRQEVLRTMTTLLAHKEHADWHTLKDEEIRLAVDLLGSLTKDMRDWIALPRSERIGKKLRAISK